MVKKTWTDVPYERGYDEYLEGYSEEECPYERGSDEAADWLEGWFDSLKEEKIADSLSKP